MAKSFNSKIADTNNLAQWIEDGITEGYINHHDYTEFRNIQYIDSGAFGSVYRATWKNRDSTFIALKSFKFNNDKCVMKEIVNEVKLLCKVSNSHKNIIQFFGITKRESNENIDPDYLLILEYADGEGIIHRDLHSKNVLALMSEITDGKREIPISSTPVDYINIYTKCWQNNPDDRPDIQQVVSDLKLINSKTNEKEIYKKTVNVIENEVTNNNDNSINDSSLKFGINYSLQIKYDELIEEYDNMQNEENLMTNNNIDLNNENETIINELFLLYEEATQKGILIRINKKI
ncbi:unnamed protein product [Rhizophagus irregularis]|nr:unnamed protein product [Rhizophagus irregularis]